jgi:hypothetical protein
MQITDSAAIRILLSISLCGLLLLWLFAPNQNLQRTRVQADDKNMIISGTIQSIKYTNKTTSVMLSYSCVQPVLFFSPIALTPGQNITVHAVVQNTDVIGLKIE